MAIDYTKPSKDVVVQKVNRDNGTSLTADMVDFGVPSPTGAVPNTAVLLTARPNSGLTGQIQIKYNRRNLARFAQQPGTTFSLNQATQVSELLAAINLQYAVNISADEIEDGPLPVFSGPTPPATQPFVLKAKASSLMYYGEVTLQVRRADIQLSALITTPVLTDLPADA